MRRRRFATGGRPRINCPNGMVWINGECMNVTPPPNIRRRHYHTGGYFEPSLNQWIHLTPHDHPHASAIPTRPRPIPRPRPRPRPIRPPGPGMPPPRIPDIYNHGGRVCNGPSTAVDEFGNNIC